MDALYDLSWRAYPALAIAVLGALAVGRGTWLARVPWRPAAELAPP